jgi:hypothetical protein
MKSILATAIVCTAATLLLTAPAHSALTYTDGDLFLCFRTTSGTGVATDIEVKLGNWTQFAPGGSFATGAPVQLSLGNFAQDLIDTYGNTWNAAGSTVQWSVVGVQKLAAGGTPANTMFASKQETTPGTQSTPWTVPSSLSAPTPAGKVQNQGVFSANGQTGNTESTNAPGTTLIQDTSAPNSYASYQPGGSNTTATQSYGYFTGGIEGSFANGTANSVLDLYQLKPASGNGPATDLGTIQINNSGVVTFTAVPEPTTGIALAAGTVVLGFLRRRRTVAA